MQSAPIGVLDSGMGGLSVLHALRRAMPHERFLYYGDNANAPYGPRPPEEIRALTARTAWSPTLPTRMSGRVASV